MERGDAAGDLPGPQDRLADGYEASFLPRAGDPLTDLRHLRQIRLRFKQGVLLDP